VLTYLKQLKLNRYDDRETRRLIWNGEYKPSIYPSKILDLGAHKGMATEYFARRYPDAIVHAYEPNPALYKKLCKKTKKYKNVTAFNEAISDHDGIASFYISTRSVSSSLFGNGKEEKVRCVTLQTVIKRIGTPVFIKMDIEGAEFDAIKELPDGIVEIRGEVHPNKANRTNEEFIKSLEKYFHVVSVREGKGTFYAV